MLTSGTVAGTLLVCGRHEWPSVPVKYILTAAEEKKHLLIIELCFLCFFWFCFYIWWMGIEGDSCLARFARPVDRLSVSNSSFIIICPFLDKVIASAVKEPDCLSTPPSTPLLCCSLILSGSCWDHGEIPWNDYKKKPERRCPSSARGPWGIKTRFEWRARVRNLSGLPNTGRNPN